jgi:hypothetical protein
MCDCYNHKCKECNIKLPIHLGDFSTGSDEIEVFCKDHIPEHNVRVFTITENYCGEENEFPIGWKMGIRSLTENAIHNENMNYPNLASEYTVEKK